MTAAQLLPALPSGWEWDKITWSYASDARGTVMVFVVDDELDHRQGVGATIAEAVQDAIEGYGP